MMDGKSDIIVLRPSLGMPLDASGVGLWLGVLDGVFDGIELGAPLGVPLEASGVGS